MAARASWSCLALTSRALRNAATLRSLAFAASARRNEIVADSMASRTACSASRNNCSDLVSVMSGMLFWVPAIAGVGSTACGGSVLRFFLARLGGDLHHSFGDGALLPPPGCATGSSGWGTSPATLNRISNTEAPPPIPVVRPEWFSAFQAWLRSRQSCC